LVNTTAAKLRSVDINRKRFFRSPPLHAAARPCWTRTLPDILIYCREISLLRAV
jgi:hypothetical protein